jgi:hypothetical protein
MPDNPDEHFRAFYGEAAEGNLCGLRAMSTALPDHLPVGSTTRCLPVIWVRASRRQMFF